MHNCLSVNDLRVFKTFLNFPILSHSFRIFPNLSVLFRIVPYCSESFRIVPADSLATLRSSDSALRSGFAEQSTSLRSTRRSSAGFAKVSP